MSKLLKAYREMALTGNAFRGLSLLQHADEVEALVQIHHARSLLDYGSGAGDAYRSPHDVNRKWGIPKSKIRCYDPSFPGLDAPPVGRFDAVICSDVLEHIPEDSVEAFITRLSEHAIKFVWASVCCRPAKKTFLDGTNLHVTLHPIEWWYEKFETCCRARTPFYLSETP